MMRRLFKSLGMDWDQFKALLIVSIRMDFRGHRGMGGRHRRMSPIFRSLIFYAVMGSTLSVSLAPKAGIFLYSILTLAYSMTMTAFAVILEFGNTLINPDDAEVLGCRPIHSRTYFLAKLCNLMFFVLLIGSALGAGPAFIGILLPDANWTFPLIFYPVSIAAGFTTACFIVLVYTGLVQVMPYERFKDVVAYLQIGFTFVLFLSYQMIPRMSQTFIQRGTEPSGTWLYGIPPAWFAGGIKVLLGMGRSVDFYLTLTAIILPGLLVLFAFRKISLQYAHRLVDTKTEQSTGKRIEDVATIPVREGWPQRLARLVLRSPEAVAGFRLTSTMLKRDRAVKMGVYPVFGFPLAFLVLAIIDNEIIDPFVEVPFLSHNSMSTMVVFFIFFMIYFFVMGMAAHREYEAGWVFHAAPMVSPGRFYQGVKLMILVRLMIPFFLVLGAIYCTQIPWIHGVKHTVSLFLFGLVAFSTVSFTIKEYPFSRMREKGERIQRFAFLFFVMPFFALVLSMQTLMYKNIIDWWAVQISTFVVFIVLEFLAARRIDRTLRRKEFFA